MDARDKFETLEVKSANELRDYTAAPLELLRANKEQYNNIVKSQ
jgi:hypothetical protein